MEPRASWRGTRWSSTHGRPRNGPVFIRATSLPCTRLRAIGYFAFRSRLFSSICQPRRRFSTRITLDTNITVSNSNWLANELLGLTVRAADESGDLLDRGDQQGWLIFARVRLARTIPERHFWRRRAAADSPAVLFHWEIETSASAGRCRTSSRQDGRSPRLGTQWRPANGDTSKRRVGSRRTLQHRSRMPKDSSRLGAALSTATATGWREQGWWGRPR